MALFKWLRRALTARGFIVTCVHPDDATRIASLIDRVADNGADGVTYRNAIDHWLHTDRPIVERLVGNTTALYVEGPVYVAGGTPLSVERAASCRPSLDRLLPARSHRTDEPSQ